MISIPIGHDVLLVSDTRKRISIISSKEATFDKNDTRLEVDSMHKRINYEYSYTVPYPKYYDTKNNELNIVKITWSIITN